MSMEEQIVPDLATSSVLDWFRNEEPSRPDIAANPLTAAEAHPETEQALTRLGRVLDETAGKDPGGLAANLLTGPGRDEMRTIMGQLGLPRTLRLLDWIIQARFPETDAILAALLAPDALGIGQSLQATLSQAARPPLLERIYAPERLTALMAACQPTSGRREAA
jgi:hypothetical protein